jgi:hypothetical protein
MRHFINAAFAFLGSALLAGAAVPGTKLWEFSESATNISPPAIGRDGTVYFGQRFYSVTNVVIPGGGTITSTNETNYLAAHTPVGGQKWRVGTRLGDVAVGRSTNIYVASVMEVDTQVTLPGGAQYTIRAVTNVLGVFDADGNGLRQYTNGTRLTNTFDPEDLRSTFRWQVAVAADETVFFTDSPSLTNNADGTLYSTRLDVLGTNQEILKKAPIEGLASALTLLAPDGSLFLLPQASKYTVVPPSGASSTHFSHKTIYRLSQDGSVYSRTTITNSGFYGLAFGGDGTLYASANGKKFATLPNGNEVPLNVTELSATDLAGSRKWSFQTGEDFGPATVGTTEIVYVAGSSNLYALNPNGTERWRYPIGNTNASEITLDFKAPLSPALTADGLIYCVATNSTLLALTTNGVLSWAFQVTNGIITQAPIIGPEGNVYLVVDDNKLVAVQGTAPPADSPWPMYQHDAQRTGRAPQRSLRPPQRQPDGTFAVPLNLEIGVNYRVQASTNLTNWLTLTTFTSTNAAQIFIDTEAAIHAHRYYRIVSP